MTATRVVRLQVQSARLKPARVYDPAPLRPVSTLALTPRGAVGDGGLDVHHADHPHSRNRDLANGLSLFTLAGYASLREAFGPHLVDGIAGESLLLDGPLPPGDLLLETDEGSVRLSEVAPAPPCVEFTRFCLGGPAGRDEVAAGLERLRHGARGWYARVEGSGTVRVGARLLPF